MSDLTTATTTMTIVVADDHAVVRSGLRLLLDAEPELEVIAEAGDMPGCDPDGQGAPPDGRSSSTSTCRAAPSLDAITRP